MRKILLTGFEPFLSYPMNPTQQIVEQLHGQVIGQFQVHSEVLPVDFQIAGEQLMTFIEANKPTVVLSLGLAGGRSKITPERIAVNVNDGPKDNNGHQPVDEVIALDGADGYFSTLPLRQMVKNLHEAGLPATISNSAGTYLCNHVMYRALHYAVIHQLDMQAGFIHLPASHELAIQHGKIPSWSLVDLKRGIDICLQTIATSFEEQRS